MNSAVYFSLLIFLFCDLITAENSTNIEDRIVGGRPATIRRTQYQVAIITPQYFCGGSLILWDWVVTAGHCLEGIKPRQIQVRAGSKYLDRLGVRGTGYKIIRHPRFNRRTLNYDIGLVQLKYGFQKFNTKYDINIIPLLNYMPRDGATMSVSGYGATSTNGPIAPSLRKAYVRKINMRSCNRSYGGGLTRTMFCAGGKNRDACQGDSGGPIVYNGRLAGIVSWGYDCADPRYPGVYTSIPQLRSWIISKTRRN